jgi:hypothetical protein
MPLPILFLDEPRNDGLNGFLVFLGKAKQLLPDVAIRQINDHIFLLKTPPEKIICFFIAKRQGTSFHPFSKRFVLFIHFRIMLRLVDLAVDMICRSVDREYLERFLSRVDEIVLGSRRDHDHISRPKWPFFSVQDRLSLAAQQEKRLFNMMMRFLTDVLPGFDVHNDKLAFLSSKGYLSEKTIFLGFLNVIS